MKSKALILLFLFFSWTSKAQNFQLKIIGNTNAETKTIDSIGYHSKHQNTKSTVDETNQLSEKLSKEGFIENHLLENKKINDSIYQIKIALGEKINFIHIYIGIKKNIKILDLFESPDDTLIIPYIQLESFLNNVIQKSEQRGYTFAKAKLINIQKKNKILYADLEFSSGQKRQLNEIVIKHSNTQQQNQFPRGALKQINQKFSKTDFNQETVHQIHDEFGKFPFINQVKFPELLFTKDTTKVYIYLEKRKSNNFDGYLGFNNTENKKTKPNGYLDITLNNALHNGEQLSIYWKNDGNNQKIFNANIDLPYLFNSPIGLKALINIFKQDSTYQNTKTELNLGYLINIHKRIYVGYQSTESSIIQNSTIPELSDYKNSFITSHYEYIKSNYSNAMIPIKSYLSLYTGTGKRIENETNTTNNSTKQSFVAFTIMNNFFINNKNCLHIKSQNYFLQSKTYLINELFRFGGLNSVRGFSENSLQANLMTSILTEYRYLISSHLYLNSLLDYCYYKDPTVLEEKTKTHKLLSVGLGLAIQTNSGLLKITFANGSTRNREIKYSNTFAAISYNVKF